MLCAAALPAVLVTTVSDRKVWKPHAPYFIAAYWPAKGEWQIHPMLYERLDDLDLVERVNQLQNGGWQRVTILSLPPCLGDVE
jgi:hypothetical protein